MAVLKGGALTGEDLAAYQAAWNRANGADYAYSQAAAGGKSGGGGSIPLLKAPSGWSAPQQTISAGSSPTASAVFAPGAAASSLTSTATAAPNPLQQQALNDVKARLAAPDPLQAESIQNLRNRMSADTTKRAINVAQSGISDSLAGALQRARESAAARGTGGNIENETSALEQGAQRAGAGAAANIALGREAQLDQLALGANTAYQAPSQREANLLGLEQSGASSTANTQGASLDRALETWRAQQAAQAQQQQLQQQAAQAQTAQVMNLFNTLWS